MCVCVRGRETNWNSTKGMLLLSEDKLDPTQSAMGHFVPDHSNIVGQELPYVGFQRVVQQNRYYMSGCVQLGLI